jgi:hypothetical protein
VETFVRFQPLQAETQVRFRKNDRGYVGKLEQI